MSRTFVRRTRSEVQAASTSTATATTATAVTGATSTRRRTSVGQRRTTRCQSLCLDCCCCCRVTLFLCGCLCLVLRVKMACRHTVPGSVDTTSTGYHQEALVPLGSETHAGEDISLHAMGPGASKVQGVIEQNVVFHVINQALGLIDAE